MSEKFNNLSDIFKIFHQSAISKESRNIFYIFPLQNVTNQSLKSQNEKIFLAGSGSSTTIAQYEFVGLKICVMTDGNKSLKVTSKNLNLFYLDSREKLFRFANFMIFFQLAKNFCVLKLNFFKRLRNF